MYVHALLDVHGKYRAMVEGSFSGETGFLKSLDKVTPDQSVFASLPVIACVTTPIN